MEDEATGVSTRPYLLRALHEWCTDSGLTPYIVVRVDDSVQVPREYVSNGEIVLNVSEEATSALQISNELVSFKARFGGKPREILVPVGRVTAIYARENGQGMAFTAQEASPAPVAPQTGGDVAMTGLQSVKRVTRPVARDADEPPPKPVNPNGRRPALKRVK